MDYLKLRGILAVERVVTAGGPVVGDVLLEEASGRRRDLVAGGYGPRLREMFFNGVTRHVVSHADLPVIFGSLDQKPPRRKINCPPAEPRGRAGQPRRSCLRS